MKPRRIREDPPKKSPDSTPDLNEDIPTPEELLADLLAYVKGNPFKAAELMGRVLGRLAQVPRESPMTKEAFLAILEEEKAR